MPAKTYDFVWTVGADFIRDIWLKSGADADLRGSIIKMELRNPVNDDLILSASTDHTVTPLARVIGGYGVITVHIEDSIVPDLTGLPDGYVSEPIPSPDRPTTVYSAYCVYGLSVERLDGIVFELMRGKVGFRQMIAAI